MASGHRIPRAAFAQAWNNPDLTTDDIAAMFGVHRSSISIMGPCRGLAPRKIGAKPKHDREAFARLWLAGVTTAEIAMHMSMARNYPGVLARSIGLPARWRGWRGGITMADYLAIRLRNALAARAREEQAALINAEMVDGRRAA